MSDLAPWSRAEFEQRLHGQQERYHIHHPFHLRMAEGRLTRAQMQGWVANRFHYQVSIPLKDAAIIANCPDREVRREWLKRIADHDGGEGNPGGIERWLVLGEAVGLARGELISQARVLPGVRFAVGAYLQFARSAPWQEAVAASLTELFAPHIHQQRLDLFPVHYPWIAADGLAYFRQRTSEARRDVEHGLRLTLDHFTTRAQQERAVEVLRFKLDVLWAMADAMWLAYVGYEPGPA
jgi:pyrroloquinoline-quinone synthase